MYIVSLLQLSFALKDVCVNRDLYVIHFFVSHVLHFPLPRTQDTQDGAPRQFDIFLQFSAFLR